MRAFPVLLAGFSVTATTAAIAAPRLHSSTGTLQPGSVIEIVLDSAAAGGDVMGKTTKTEWLGIEPAWPGTTVWKEPNIIEFRPSEAPKLATKYTFKLKDGHRTVEGTPIPATDLGSFETEQFQCEYARMIRSDDEHSSIRQPVFYLRFNADVAPEKAAPFLFFEADGGKRIAAKTSRATFGQLRSPYYLGKTFTQRFTEKMKPQQAAAEGAVVGGGIGGGSNDDDDEGESGGSSSSGKSQELPEDLQVANGLIVTPTQELPLGKNWRLSLLRGLPDATGKLATLSDSAQQVGDIDPLVVKAMEPVVEADQPRQIQVTFNCNLPVDMDSSAVEVTPRPKDLLVEVNDNVLTLKGDFSTDDSWLVNLKGNLTSSDGRALGQAFQKQVQFKPVEPVLALPSQDEAQLASGARKYPVQTVNIGKLHVRAKKLEGPGMVRAEQGYRYYTGTRPDGKNVEDTQPIPYELMVGETIADFEIDLTNGKDTSAIVALDWDKLLAGDAKPYELNPKKEEAGPSPASKKPAAFFLELVGSPKEGIEDQKDTVTQALIQLTDIGLAWKIIDDEAKVFAFSTLTGKPLSGVNLRSYGEDAKQLQQAVTDANGLASLPREDKARHLQAATGGDSYTVTYDTSLPTVDMWRFPVRTAWDEGSPRDFRKVFLFTDRSLYRPGETVHLKGVVRRQEGNDIVASPAGKAELIITDPRQREIYHQPVTVSERGTFDLSLPLPAENTGTHYVQLVYPDELAKVNEDMSWKESREISASARFTTTFRVEEFRRNAFEVHHQVTPPATGAKEVSLTVKANSFQGQPVANAEVQQYTRVRETNFYPEKYQDFLFGDHRTQDYGYWYHYFGYRWDDEESGRRSDNQSSHTKLAADGSVVVTAKLPDGDFPATREVTISTEVTDANQQALNEQSEITVHPADVYVGIKRLDRLVRVGDRLPLDLIAVTPDGQPFSGELSVQATLTREVNEQVRISDGLRTGAVRNETRREELSKTTLALNGGKGTEFLFAPNQPGVHQIELRGTDAQGHAFATAVSLNVYGSKEYPWAYEDGMKIKLVAEKKVYQPGDTAKVLVLSPIEGTALVTVEREKVLKSFITELRADKPVLEIPVTDAEAPNVFVSVMVIKGAQDSGRMFKEPQLRLGYCELMVDDVKDRLKVALNTPADSVRPGEDLTLSGTVTLADGRPAANAEVTLYAEDEGTLAVMGYATPDPMQFFYDPRNLQVECGTTLERLLSESPENQVFYNKGFFIGGGGEDSELPPLALRSDFNPCATWAPALTTDASGRFTTTFKLPDTLTRYRVIAVAVEGASRFGGAEGAVTVNKDVMLEPQELRFANEGDSLNVQALVTNASKTGGTWKIHLDTGFLSSEPIATLAGDGAHQTVTLAAGGSATVVFPVKFGNTGDASFKWSAVPVSLDGGSALTPALTRRLSDAVENRFPVNYPMPLLRQEKLVALKPGETDLMGQLDPALVKGRGTVDLEFSGSLLAEAAGGADFLLHYPYGCVEQTTSSMMPWLAADQLRGVIPAFAKTTPENVKKALQTGVNRLLSMQTSDGGFGYWPGARESLPWASPYAGLGLMMAASQGAAVPESAKEALCQNLERSLRGLGEVKSAQELEVACRAIWVLAIADKHPDSYINMMKGRMAELTPGARCMLALAAYQAKTVPDAAVLLRDATPFKGRDDRWMRWSADKALDLFAWSVIAPDAKEADEALASLVRDQDPYGTWRTTWVNAWALLGMASYADHDKARQPAHVNLATSDGSEQLTLTADRSKGQDLASARTYPLLPNLKLSAKTDNTAYVRVKLASKPDLLPSKPVAKNGLEVTRYYERVNPDGTSTPLDKPKKGDLIRVRLVVQQPNDLSRYLVVEDNLPSIFEAVNNDFSSQAANGNAGRTSENNWSVSHSEVRADRVMFFFDTWYRSSRTLTYLARCTMDGQAMAPPAKVESMYDPDSIALSASRQF